MKRLKALLILVFILSTIVSFAQYPIQGEYQSISLSTIPNSPSYQASIIDNSVPSPIQMTRVSDYYAPSNWYPTHEYAKTQTWNADQTLYKMRSNWVSDATTHQITHDLSNIDIYPAYWSNVNSDLIYSFNENGQIKTYSLNSSTLTTVYTISGYDIIKLGPGEGNIDKNDKYVALVGKRNTDLDVIIFDLELNQVIHTEIYAGAWGNGEDWAPQYIDWISVSQSGDYVGIMWNHNTTNIVQPFNGHYGVEIYSTTDMSYLRRIVDYGNHGDFGYAQNGDEVFVQFWGPALTDYVNMYYLDRTESETLTTHPDFNGAGHISCRNINRPGWAYVTQSSADQSGQIIALKLDTSGVVEHFGHHNSSSTSYNKDPMAVASPNGDKVMYRSDFGDASNTDLVYAFQNTADLNSLNITDYQIDNLSIHPNPAKESLHIKIEKLINTVYVYNSLGQKINAISNINDSTYILNTGDLNSGTYFIRVETNDSENHSKLFVKN
jgi:hypothetical protein|nr:T9SS type A sorting domain-containing protein [uncultured Psychroserpens sp.]